MTHDGGRPLDMAAAAPGAHPTEPAALPGAPEPDRSPPRSAPGPAELDAIAEALLAAIVAAWPVSATVKGLAGAHDRLLTDYSAAGQAALSARAAQLASRAEAVDPGTLSQQQRVTRAVIRQRATDLVTRLDGRLVEFGVAALTTAPAAELLASLPMITLTRPGQAEAYLDRLAAVPAALRTAAQRHRDGLADGLLPVRHLVLAAADQVDLYLASDADPLAATTPGGDAAVDPDDFADRRARLLADAVRPAFARYRDALRTDIAPGSRDADRPGLCHLPGGAQLYSRLAALHTTTAHSPEQLHRTGLDAIARLAEEYRQVGARAFGLTTLPEIFDRLRTDPALRWRDADELLAAARAAITRAEAVAPAWFGRLPATPCQVRPVPAEQAPAAMPAYYLPPALDGSRPGIYFANTHRAAERLRTTGEATAFHEAVPGHHTQLSLFRQLTDLPPVRRLTLFTACSEGWGLYAERLAAEMGLYSGEVDLLGMLSLDSLRAARLVVDTGLHALGWTRAQAVRFMLEHTPVPPLEVQTEVDRYIAAPGQALAYLVGRLEIERLRAQASGRLGAAFDIRAFHDTLLGYGSLPLTTLGEVVDDWVRAQLTGA